MSRWIFGSFQVIEDISTQFFYIGLATKMHGTNILWIVIKEL